MCVPKEGRSQTLESSPQPGFYRDSPSGFIEELYRYFALCVIEQEKYQHLTTSALDMRQWGNGSALVSYIKAN
jgi:hypothetical protein